MTGRGPAGRGRRFFPRAVTFFLGAGPLRATAEALAVTGLLGLALWVAADEARQPFALDGDLSTQALVVGPLCAMAGAARLRLGTGSRPFVVAREGAVAAALTLPTAAVQTATVYGWDNTFGSPAGASRWAIAAFLVWDVTAFAFFRGLAHLWPRWVRLRRGRLRWEMTHASLLTVAAVAAVAVVVVFLLSLRGGPFALVPDPSASPAARVAGALPALGIMIFLTVATLVALLPPAALISYLAARRTVLRLEALASATSRFGELDLSGRVAIEGEDEIARVQRDFNAMADRLEGAVRELRAERDRVDRLLRAQRDLVANVSHELRTPVATMRGYLEAALDLPDGSTPLRLRHDLEVVERETVRLQRPIDDLFVLSRAEASGMTLDLRPTDVAAVLRRCAEAVAEGAWRSGRVEVVCDAADGDAEAVPLPSALADEGRLEQIVRNLLDNAVRHTPPGGIVTLGATAAPGAVVVAVENTGEGIEAGDRARVFERFYRSDAARARDHAGAGLGLALVKELTEAMGGCVSAKSEPDRGSRFTVRLPLA